MTNIVCFIPARYESTRLPGKPLLKINNISVINRVYFQVKKCRLINDIIVLTDDERIKKEVENIEGKVEIISDDCLNGTERIVKYLKKNNKSADLIVNVQGDEPFVNPEHIDLCIKNYYKKKFDINLDLQINNPKKIINNNLIKCSTLCHRLENKFSILNNKNIGKVVLNNNNDIMYCSRNIIPMTKNDTINENTFYYGHIGVFVFDKEYLLNEYLNVNTHCQLTEDIEWLKIIEQGYKINAYIVENPEKGIDTKEDYEYFLKKYN